MIDRRKCGPLAAWPVALAALLLPCGCGSSAEDGLPPSDPNEGVSTPPVFEDSGATQVNFDVGRALTLHAGEVRELQLEVLPLGKHTIRLALVGNGTEAFLSDSIVYTNEQGVAPPVSLTVVEANSEFSVRAAVGRVETELHIVTLPADTGTLVITPYYAGGRDIDEWVGSVHVDKSCTELAGTPPPDGSVVSEAPFGQEIRLEGVPAGRRLAVVVRSEQIVGGCHDAEPIPAGMEANVSLELVDRPLQVEGLTMDVSFGLILSSDLLPALDELIYRAVSPMVAGASDDLEAVLQAMAGAAATPQAFTNARNANNWRNLLLANLDPALAGNGLRTLSRSWMQSGLNRLTPDDAIRGSLSSSARGDTGSLTLTSVAGLDPVEAGFDAQQPASIDTETNDFMRIGATLPWRPSPLLSNLAKLEAVVQFPEATTAAQALGLAFGCESVATRLVDNNGNAPTGQSFNGCDLACTVDLCAQAMVTLWSRVDGSDLPVIPWDISAGAQANLDADARPEALEGSWAGSLPVDDFGIAPMNGAFDALKPAN
jgi:hypothetical protein